MSQTVSPSTAKPYGVQRVAQVWHVARSTVYAQRRRRAVDTDPPVARRRPGPRGPCDDATLVSHIRQVLADSPFHGEGYRKVWARLRFNGLHTSKERVRRLMREAGLQAPQRTGHRHGPKVHDRSIIPDGPNKMWGTDLTGTVTVEDGQVGVFVAAVHTLRGPRADPPGRAGVLRWFRGRRGRRPDAAPRPRQPVPRP